MRLLSCGLAVVLIAASAAAGPDKDQWQTTVDKAIGYLKSSQDMAGSWSANRSPGITGIILTGLLKTGRVKPEEQPAANALKYIETLINEKAGHIAGQDPKPQLLNYVTSVNVMALQAANRDDKYRKVIGDAAEFLKKLQLDEGEGKSPKDDFYGGAGYDSKSRPDLSNTQYLPRRAAGGRRTAETILLCRRRWSSSAVARTSRASTTISPGPARSTTAVSSTPRPPAARPRPTSPRRRLARLRQHDLCRRKEHDLLRRR